MVRALILGADEMSLYSGERHASTDSGVFDDGQVVYDESGRVVQNEILIKPRVEAYQPEENELVYGKNGEITEIENNNNIVTAPKDVILGSEGEESGTLYESLDEAEESPAPVEEHFESESEDEIIEIDDEESEKETEGEESVEEVDQEYEEESESESIEEAEDRVINNVDLKESIRSELQELLAEEEAAMVKLTKEVELSALEEKRIANKLKDEHVIKDSDENQHHMPNPTDGLLRMNGNGDVVLTTESDQEISNGDVKNGHSSSESETEEQPNGDLQTGQEEEVEQEVVEQEVVETEEAKQEVAMETSDETQQAPKEEEMIETKPRRSSRIKKVKKVNSDLFVEMNLKTSVLEGHHHDVCSVDMFGKFILSAGRDTSLKLWDSSTNVELQSLGGHENTITKVLFVTDQPYQTIPPALTASTDCSVRLWDLDEGKMTKSIYVYNTVTCMDYSNGNILVGTDGGKMEVYELESGQQKYSVNAFKGLAITEVKFFEESKAVCGGTNGVIKIFNTTANEEEEEEKTAIFTLDSDNVTINSKSETDSETPTNATQKLNMSKINCLDVYENLIIYGDNGYNIKILDYQKGEMTKIRNNLKEFCPTEALHIGQFQSASYLFSVGSDVDSGDAYVNIRSLPDLQYLGTIRDIETSSGSVTCFTQQDINNKLHFVTGGSQLRLWNQIVKRGKKRKNSPNGDLSYVPCKYICNFTDPRDSEPETEDNETELESSTEQMGKSESSTERIPAGKSWCVIL